MKKIKKAKKVVKKPAPKKKSVKKLKKSVKKVFHKKISKPARRHGKEKKSEVVKAAAPSDEILAGLLDKASLRGFITENELLYTFPEVEDYLKAYEDFIDSVERKGIIVVETGEMILGRKKEQKETMQKLGIGASDKKHAELPEISLAKAFHFWI